MPTLLSYLTTKFGRVADVDVFTKTFRPMEPWLSYVPFRYTRHETSGDTTLDGEHKYYRNLNVRLPVDQLRGCAVPRYSIQDAVEEGRLVELTNREVYSSSCREVG